MNEREKTVSREREREMLFVLVFREFAQEICAFGFILRTFLLTLATNKGNDFTYYIYTIYVSDGEVCRSARARYATFAYSGA